MRTALAQRDERIKAARAWANTWRRIRGDAEMPTMDPQYYGDHLTPMVLLTLPGLVYASRRGTAGGDSGQAAGRHTVQCSARRIAPGALAPDKRLQAEWLLCALLL